MKFFWAIIVFFFAVASKSFCEAKENQLEIYLNDISYQNGVFSTKSGGYLQAEAFYLQAKNLTYIHKLSKTPIEHSVEAKEKIALYKDKHLFIGENCFYDFTQQKGYIEDAKTSYGIYLIEAGRIVFNPDKSYDAYDVTLTTITQDEPFSFSVNKLHVYDNTLKVHNFFIKVCKVPLLWVPAWQHNLDKPSSSPLQYRLNWDTGQGPQISFRYNALSYNHFNLFLRGDYRYKRGPAGAIEMDYTSLDGHTKFLSKNYGAYDTFYNDDQPNKKKTRFRLQTILQKTSRDLQSGIDLTFDRMTDKNMPQDFNMDRFELNTQKKNICTFYNKTPFYNAQAIIAPRVNGYQGFNQKIPEIKLHVHPITFLNSSVFFFNNFNLSFYDYVYSNMLLYPEIYSKVLQDFHAVRAQTTQQISAPFHLKFLNLVPFVGFKGIIYSNSKEHKTAYQSVMDYGLKSFLSFEKKHSNNKHIVTTYIDYQGLYKPALPIEKVYIFSLADGYNFLNQVTFGFEQQWRSLSSSSCYTKLDCYGLSFFGDTTYKLAVPKAGFYLTSNYHNLSLSTDLRWNFNNKVLDRCNISCAYSQSAIASFYIEFRYRSAYDYRKCDHQSYILDVARPIEELLNSPISDKRYTLISKASVYLAPKWRCNLQMHNGWGRLFEPGYTEAKVDLTTYLSSAWQLKLSYAFTTRGKSHFGLKIDLNK